MQMTMSLQQLIRTLKIGRIAPDVRSISKQWLIFAGLRPLPYSSRLSPPPSSFQIDERFGVIELPRVIRCPSCAGVGSRGAPAAVAGGRVEDARRAQRSWRTIGAAGRAEAVLKP